ncbi:MAG: Fe(3+) ABC transporter substrate-binding protein, partial [Alphaproteobacteria bacterium]
VNVSGAALVKAAPNRENGLRLIAFLLEPEAQRLLADGSMEYPANPKVAPHPVLGALGAFRQDEINADAYAKNSAIASRLMDETGWT